jgi:hypothetical protein
VTVTSGVKVLATRLEGQVVELDPGEYDLDFSASGFKPLSAHFVVARGERNRLLRVELEPLEASRPAVAPAAELPPAASSTVPALFAGVALLGVGGFVTLGAWGRSSESKLELRCAPRCEHDQVADVRTKYVLADVSLGVGVASLALAAYTFLRQAPAPASAGAGVSMQAGRSDVSMTYGGRF